MIHLMTAVAIQAHRKNECRKLPDTGHSDGGEARGGKGQKMIYLNIGDPPQYGFPPFKVIAEGVKNALDENWKGYAPSEGDEHFRKTVAKIEKCRPEDVFAVAGLTEGIDFFHSFIGFGEKSAAAKPGISSLPEQGEAVLKATAYFTGTTPKARLM